MRTATLQLDINGTEHGVRFTFNDEELALARSVNAEHTMVELQLARVLADQILSKYKDAIVWENVPISSE